MDLSKAALRSLAQRFRPYLAPTAVGLAVAFLGVVLGMRLFFAPRARKAYLQAETARDLMALALLQERHHRWSGTYASDLGALVRISGDPKGFTAMLDRHLDLDTLLVSATSTQFLIEANVLDDERTLMHFEGPLAKEEAAP